MQLLNIQVAAIMIDLNARVIVISQNYINITVTFEVHTIKACCSKQCLKNLQFFKQLYSSKYTPYHC
jgi:hypothetical protein